MKFNTFLYYMRDIVQIQQVLFWNNDMPGLVTLGSDGLFLEPPNGKYLSGKAQLPGHHQLNRYGFIAEHG